ncbi:2OG-Fe(II) oxygenase [Pseudomonas gingeri]|uniref:2OG-Fe(II) oxygenase n=1 Tax=Pseudomonas gingeri TaxID=117681 RepID=A0A7Y8CMU7_9PSED|nr:2OG-Fe(II) oxygenase [Pseudomonas gingeri]NWB31158.1 2OG-Fe(II) oxygenase [Pseudomonas gingeri]NWC37053.1 2OG-Fe(II) oxygenase [Pseudomonas gingeri]
MNSFVDTLVPGAIVPSATVELPLGGTVRCVLVHGFLSASECEALVQATEQRGFATAETDYPSSYRDNDRLLADDPALAGRLFERLMDCASRMPGLWAVMNENDWRMVAVNERLRFCCYRPGTQFGPHQDGVYHRQNAQSRLTFMVYLNDEGFSGGETVFFEGRSSAMANQEAAGCMTP